MDQDPVAERFELTEWESLSLTLSKLSLMETDLEGDSDHEDRVIKRAVIRRYSELFAAKLGVDTDGETSSRREPGWRDAREMAVALADELTPSDAAPLLRDAVRGLGPDGTRYILTSPDLSRAALQRIAERRRAIVLMVELGAFSPWPEGTGWESKVRSRGLGQLVDAMSAPVDDDLMGEIDGRLSSAVKSLSRKDIDKKRIAWIAAGGVAIGALTGGLAAPLIGSALGGAMGLSGAAATGAGLALLGGGSVAAGGLGVAGGTAVIAGLTGVGAAGAGAAGTWLRGASVNDVVVESAKLEVLFDYVMLREEKDDDLQRLVVERLQQQIAELVDEVNELTDLVASQQENAGEREELKRRLEEEKEKRRVLERALDDLRTLQRESANV